MPASVMPSLLHEVRKIMTLIIVGLVMALIAFVYIVKAPAPGGAVPRCAGILLGVVISGCEGRRSLAFNSPPRGPVAGAR